MRRATHLIALAVLLMSVAAFAWSAMGQAGVARAVHNGNRAAGNCEPCNCSECARIRTEHEALVRKLAADDAKETRPPAIRRARAMPSPLLTPRRNT
jgi:hypothetical protein